MKVRYIAEGFFKNPEQARAARQKELEKSSQQEIADIYNKVVTTKVKSVIKEAIKRNGIYPFPLNMFSYGINSDSVKLDKKEVECSIENENGSNVLHLSFDYGKFVVDKGPRGAGNDCNSLVINSWVVQGWEICDKMTRESSERSMISKIKKYASKRMETCSKENEGIYKLIVESPIIIDNISMYKDPDCPESLNFKIYHNNNYSNDIWGLVSTKNKRINFVRSFNGTETNYFGYYKHVLNGLVDIVDFGVPIDITLIMHNYSTSEAMPSMNLAFGYETFGELEEAAGAKDAVWAGIMKGCKKYLEAKCLSDKTSFDELSEKYKKMIAESSYAVFDYIDVYQGKWFDGKGFKIYHVNQPVLRGIVFGDHDMKKYCDYYCFLESEFTNIEDELTDRRYISISSNMKDGYDNDVHVRGEALALYDHQGYTMDKSVDVYAPLEKVINFMEDLIGPAYKNNQVRF